MAGDQAGKKKLLQRIHRLRGQIDAVDRAVTNGEECGSTLMLLAAARGAVNGLMREVLEDHIRNHVTGTSPERIAPDLAEDLIDLVRGYLK
jgi:DNA-binding FrmR family transcriptional regulator